MSAEPPSIRLGPADAARCRRRIHLEHDPEADRTLIEGPDPGMRLRGARVDAHRAAVAARFGAAGPDAGLTLTDADPHSAADVRVRRPPILRTTRLRSANRLAIVDLLLAAPGGGYVPVLVCGHRTTEAGSGIAITDLAALTDRPAHAPLPSRRLRHTKTRSHHADALALAHVYRLLEQLGLAAGERRGGIVGYGSAPPTGTAGADDAVIDDGAIIVWHDLARPQENTGISVLQDYDLRFADRYAVALAAATRSPALAEASRIAECRHCPWWVVCGPQLSAAHDVSLVASGSDVGVLREAGASTYDHIASMDPAALAALPLTGTAAEELRLKARALQVGAPVVRRRAAVTVTRADVELDVDMESYGQDGAYLWGTFLSGRAPAGFAAGYRPFVTWQPLADPATGAVFVEFWRYLTDLRAAAAAAGLSFAAYCYSHQAEERWLYATPARFPDEPGMPGRDEVARFCNSPQWVDLYEEIKRQFVVPGSLRLKAIAPVAGFSWRDAEPGGENSMAWYQVAIGAVDPSALGFAASDADSLRQRILRYNEDDVIATARLRQWMSQHADEVPLAADL